MSFLFALLFTACGGGSSASDETSSNFEAVTQTSSSTPRDVPVGTTTQATRIVDASGVQGLEYECQSTRAKTTQNGVFHCNSLPASFYLGNLPLGSVNSINNAAVYTTDLLGEARGATHHPDVTKLSMLLQSLDEDQNPFNGIEISQKTIDITNQYFYADSDLSAMSLLDVQNTLQEILTARKNLALVDVKNAQDNLTTSLATNTN